MKWALRLILGASAVVATGCGYEEPGYYSYQTYYANEAALAYSYPDYLYDWMYYAKFDWDLDSIPDHYDFCPRRPGAVENYGCPYVKYYATCIGCCSWLRLSQARYYLYWSWYYLPNECYW